MNRKLKERVHSGFTLLEIMVVVGIIAGLTAVLVPTMTNYLTRSRLNTANSNAKVIFNSLQTIMQEYEFMDRSEPESLFYGTDNGGNIQLYCVNGNIQTSGTVVQDSSGGGVTVSAADLGATATSAGSGTLGGRMRRLYSDYESMSWCALIKDYSVMGVLCASSTSTHYIGGYPIQITEKDLGDITAGRVTLRNTVQSSSIGENSPLGIYCKKAWNNESIFSTKGAQPETNSDGESDGESGGETTE